MNNFNPRDFLYNIQKYIPPTEEDIDKFNLFITQRFMSMSNRVDGILDKINTKSFHKLPKKYQCLAFTSLYGGTLTGYWQIAKKTGIKKSNKEIKDKVCKLFDCSENEANDYIKNKLIDIKVVNELYDRIYEPNSIKVRKNKK